MSEQLQITEGCIRIGGEVTVYAAAELKAALLAALHAEPAAGRLDLANVSEIDCAGLQLLLATIKQAASAGRALRLVAASTPVRDLLALCRRSDLLAGVAS